MLNKIRRLIKAKKMHSEMNKAALQAGDSGSMQKAISAEAMENGGYKGETLQPEHHMRLHREYKEMARKALASGEKFKGLLYKKKSDNHLAQYHNGAANELPMAKSDEREPMEYKDIHGKVYNSAKERSDAEAHQTARTHVKMVFGDKDKPKPKDKQKLMAKSDEKPKPQWYAMHQGKLRAVLDIVDSKKPAHEAGGGNHYNLEGAGVVHQNEIDDLIPASEVKLDKSGARVFSQNISR
jgi:hypothetical protein